MQKWTLNPPWWGLVLSFGAAYSLLTVGSGQYVYHLGWMSALVGGGIGALVFGLVVGRASYRRSRGFREAVGGLSRPQIREAIRAARTGPIPEAPEVRAAAARVAYRQLIVFRRQAPFPFVLLALSSAAAAIGLDARGWLLVPVCLGLAALCVYVSRHLHRRIAVLQRGPAAQLRG